MNAYEQMNKWIHTSNKCKNEFIIFYKEHDFKNKNNKTHNYIINEWYHKKPKQLLYI